MKDFGDLRKPKASVFRKAGCGKSACPVCRGGGATAPPYSTGEKVSNP